MCISLISFYDYYKYKKINCNFHVLPILEIKSRKKRKSLFCRISFYYIFLSVRANKNFNNNFTIHKIRAPCIVL